MRLKYYSLHTILNHNAHYNIIFGERSNGKTFQCLLYILKEYINTGKQGAIVRRWQEDIRAKRASTFFDNIISKGYVSKLTNNEWDTIHYSNSKWFLAKTIEDSRIVDERPLAYAFALSNNEHDKSTSYPDVETIVFDEFITTRYYLPDEFVLFMNLCSTIIRHKTTVKIFMLGNTHSTFCPYFKEMGLTHIRAMKPGQIDVYRYGDSKLTVAVEYTLPIENNPVGSIYFAFDNPKLKMIAGGAWEINIYPHCPIKYVPKNIIFTFFICFEENILQCEIINKDEFNFLYIHEKTTELKYPHKDLIYSPEYNPYPNWKRKITNTNDKITRKIAQYFINDNVYYQDNEIGEIMYHYLMWCRKS